MRPVVAIGPANYAGQAYAWASAVRAHLPADAYSFQRGPVRRSDFGFTSDITIAAPLFHTSLARRFRSRSLFRDATHVALDGYQPFYRLFRSRVFGKDASSLIKQGFQLALIAHGSDIRDPEQHQANDRWSYFNEGPAEWRDGLAEFARRNRAYAEDLGVPTFVSTPDLLIDQPNATWLPVCFDPTRWATTQQGFQRPRLRVLHLPSRRFPPIKGTSYIEPILQRLDQAGLIEYVSPTSVPHSDMAGLVHGCDIVIDQILTGSYGLAAVEAMAAGRLVIGRVSPRVRALMPANPPVVDADPTDLEDVVRGIVASRDDYAAIAMEGVNFAHRWHDGRESAAALAPYLGVPAKQGTP